MGNRPIGCPSSSAQHCVDECARLQSELDGSREQEEVDPAGAVFHENLQGLAPLDEEALRFAGMSNLAAMRWLFAMGSSPKARDRNATTMLHAASRSGALSIVRELLGRGIPVDSVDSSGWTPLHIAARMGRREVCMLLVRARASLQTVNKKGKTPLLLCVDPGTYEALQVAAQGVNKGASDVAQGAADILPAPIHDTRPGLGLGVAHQDSGLLACNPYFVSRVPLFHDQARRAEITTLGLELFNRSPGHGLAFIVATGIVHDHPTDLNGFLLRHRADPAQMGGFLGEDYSLAQTLRVAFINSLDLTGTGVISALCSCFGPLPPPPDLGKLDRIIHIMSHQWWRTHEISFASDDVLGEFDEGLDWPSCAADDATTDHGKTGFEISGLALRRCLHSAEGLHRFMFSTMMLCWSFQPSTALPSGLTPLRLSFNGWMDLNSSLETDGTNIPTHLQMGIYNHLAHKAEDKLLPYHGVPPPSGTHDIASSALAAGPQRDGSAESGASLVQGWAHIPHGGLERQEAATQGVLNRPRDCILSETASAPLRSVARSSRPPPQPKDDDSGETGEAVWLSLRCSAFLFLSFSPTDDAPYAFLRLKDVAIRDVDRINRNIILAGMPKSESRLVKPKVTVLPKAAKADMHDWVSPFGDTNSRYPLPLCFLLSDGRFQPFDAMWLDLQFDTDEELAFWQREFGKSCGWRPATEGDSENRSYGSRGDMPPLPLEVHAKRPQDSHESDFGLGERCEIGSRRKRSSIPAPMLSTHPPLPPDLSEDAK